MVPFYANVETTPAYLAGTTGEVSTDSFYWVSRMIAAMADASYGKSVFHVERYELGVLSACRALLNQYDAKQLAETDPARRAALRQEPTRPWPLRSRPAPPTRWIRCCLS